MGSDNGIWVVIIIIVLLLSFVCRLIRSAMREPPSPTPPPVLNEQTVQRSTVVPMESRSHTTTNPPSFYAHGAPVDYMGAAAELSVTPLEPPPSYDEVMHKT